MAGQRIQDEPRLPGWTGPALCGCTLSGSRSYLATANLTSLLPPRGGVLGLRALPSSQDEARSGHLESPANSPSGALPSFLRTRLTYSAGDGGPSASLPCQPFQRGERAFLPQLAQGGEGERASRRVTQRALAPPSVRFGNEPQCGARTSPALGSPFSWSGPGQQKPRHP